MPLSFPNPPAAANSAELEHVCCRPKSQKSDLPRYHAPTFIRLWHLASFDAPTVALVWSLSFAWIVHVRLATWVLLLQVLVVWMVYVGDRLLDARAGLRGSGDELRERHYFHWRHRRALVPLAAVAACLAAAIVFRFVPIGARERDSMLAVASLAYFTRVHLGKASRIFAKEVLVGALFTVGCALPAWSHADWKLVALPVVFFAALAWLNCRAIEAWESHWRMKIASVSGAFVLAGLVLAGAVERHHPRESALLLAGAVSSLLLAALDRFRDRIGTVTLRVAADLALLTPGFLLAAAWLVHR